MRKSNSMFSCAKFPDSRQKVTPELRSIFSRRLRRLVHRTGDEAGAVGAARTEQPKCHQRDRHHQKSRADEQSLLLPVSEFSAGKLTTFVGATAVSLTALV